MSSSKSHHYLEIYVRIKGKYFCSQSENKAGWNYASAKSVNNGSVGILLPFPLVRINKAKWP